MLLQGGQVLHNGGKVGEGSAQRQQVARVARPLRQAGDQALRIAHPLEGIAQFGHEEGFLQETGDEVLAAQQFLHAAGGVQYPVAQLAGAHGGAGAVQRAQQGVLVAASGLHQVQITAAGGIDEHGVLRGAQGKGAQVLRLAAQLVLQVVQDSRGSPQRRPQVGAAEPLQRMHPEVRFQEGICQPRQEGVAIIHQRDGHTGEILRLLLADEQLTWANAGYLLA